jgi:hypothetical protein
MKELGVWEPLMVKTQTFKTAIEAGEGHSSCRAPCSLTKLCHHAIANCVGPKDTQP